MTRKEAIAQVAAQLSEPISFNDFADRVLAINPSNAKNPRSAVRTELRYHVIEHGLIFMDNRRSWLAPAQLVMRGVRFRHNVWQWEAANGVVIIDEELLPFINGYRYAIEQIVKNDLQLLDEAGTPLSFTVKSKTIPLDVPHLGNRLVMQPCMDLTYWFLEHQITDGDSILFTIEQWNPPVWKIEHEGATDRNQAAIDAYNQELADILFEMLEAEQNDERIYQTDSVSAAVVRMANPTGYPGDPWTEVIHTDGRMRLSDISIEYIDGRHSFFDELLSKFSKEEYDDEVEPAIELSEAEANQVYRFKCWLVYNPKLWRRIEILGGQTLAEFSAILVDAFKHDPDHLSRFSHLIQRGRSKRYREVEIGTINPFEEESDNSIRIAALELSEGSLLQFIFDFGDWHEHHLHLEEILPATQRQQNAEYPRIVEQNTPEYQYCEQCEKKKKKVIATWVCYTCSEQKQREFVICDDCASKHHEDHYIVEKVY